jgi:hypothetical protein
LIVSGFMARVVTVVISKVRPSGGEPATNSAAIEVAAPGLLSTMND